MLRWSQLELLSLLPRPRSSRRGPPDTPPPSLTRAASTSSAASPARSKSVDPPVVRRIASSTGGLRSPSLATSCSVHRAGVFLAISNSSRAARRIIHHLDGSTIVRMSWSSLDKVSMQLGLSFEGRPMASCILHLDFAEAGAHRRYLPRRNQRSLQAKDGSHVPLTVSHAACPSITPATSTRNGMVVTETVGMVAWTGR